MAYQRKDHYHQRAKREGYRSRAAYKLIEIQKSHRVLRAGQKVIDLGCWPGGWLQVAGEIVGASGRVAGVDIAAVDPPLENENVFAFEGDLSDPVVLGSLAERIGGLADVLLSDAAPKLTGIRATDRAREETLLEAVESSIPLLLRIGGTLLVKVLEGPEARDVGLRIRRSFESAKTLKLAATRKGSSEQYLLARDYRGAAK